MIRGNPMGAATALIAIVALVAAALAANGSLPDRPDHRDSLDEDRTALARCRALGEAGGGDPTCQTVWAEQRQRFFGQAAPDASAIAHEPEAGR